ncbi:MAG: hypothetical protein Q4E87_08085 [bacterium]|nr:hypothetical protein [bacterium]
MEINVKFNNINEMKEFCELINVAGHDCKCGSNPAPVNVDKEDKPKVEKKVEPPKEPSVSKDKKNVQGKEKSKDASIADKDMYFFHPESDSYVEIKKGKKLPTGDGFVEVPKEEYEEQTKPKEQPQKVEAEVVGQVDNNTEPVQDVEPIKEEPKEDKPNITKEMVREVCAKAIKAGKSAEVKKIVADHGAKSIPTLKEDEYAAVYEEVGGLL